MIDCIYFFILDDKISGRGCSTKKSTYKECETHSYGENTEKFCYCTAHFCNPSSRPQPTLLSLVLPTLILITLFSWPRPHLPAESANDPNIHLATENLTNTTHPLVAEYRTIDNQPALPRTQFTVVKTLFNPSNGFDEVLV